MIVKTGELKDQTLDWAVAVCEGKSHEAQQILDRVSDSVFYSFHPSTNGAQATPIIEREIDVLRKRSKAEESSLAYPNPNFRFKAEISGDIDGYFCGFGPTLLIAAMRCYVASKLGDTVDIPQELLN